jgi:hypothetical protein
MAKDLSSTKERKKLGKTHARNALARVEQNGSPAEKKKVKAAVKKRFPSLGKKKKKS